MVLTQRQTGIIWICPGLLDGLLHEMINRLQIVAVSEQKSHSSRVPPSPEMTLHAEGIFRDPAGKFCVIVRDDEHERIHSILGRQTGNGREGFLGFAFHGCAV